MLTADNTNETCLYDDDNAKLKETLVDINASTLGTVVNHGKKW